MDDDGEQVEGFQVHLGGALGLDDGFGRKLRAHKVTSAGLDDYVTTVVADYLDDRQDGETFATWVTRADEILLRGEKPVALLMSAARGSPVPLPLLRRREPLPARAREGSGHGAWECRSCLRAFKVTMIGQLPPCLRLGSGSGRGAQR